jgi:hypothetical protein
MIIYNYVLHEKLISIIIKLRKGYFPEVQVVNEMVRNVVRVKLKTIISL